MHWMEQTHNQKKVERLILYTLDSSMNQQWLWNTPALPNDLTELELPGAWEPSESSGTPPIGDSEEAQFGIPDGNQNGEK
jgi:hypothetical protein